MKTENKTTKPNALTHEDLKILRAPFSKESLGVKVQNLSKDRTRAMLVLYLQHTDVQNRLEEVDPAWTTQVLTEDRIGDTVYVRIRMALKEVTRENVGEGADPKSAYSDALKRCAMLFGVGRYLYDSPIVWISYDESRDRFKQWTIQDYEKALKGEVAQPVQSSQLGLKTAIIRPAMKAARSREQLNRSLMNLYRPYLTKFPNTKFAEILKDRYQVEETRLMTVEQMDDFVQFLEEKLKSVA